MEFRSVQNLSEHLRAGLHLLPRGISLVAGVPRSGMLPATLLALYLNCQLTDVDGLLSGSFMQPGLTRPGTMKKWGPRPLVLVLDDSICSGRQLTEVRRRVDSAGLDADVLFAAVYATDQSKGMVDFYFNICPLPRVFEWNLFHYPGLLAQACLDIDGVLCRDPREEENDDGPRYRDFLKEAEPKFLPTAPVKHLVSCRLEKYRSETEGWLKKHKVNYENLFLLNLPSKRARQRLNLYAPFKSHIFRKTNAVIFVESSDEQAKAICSLSHKPVISVESMICVNPGRFPESNRYDIRTALRYASVRFEDLFVRRLIRS